MGLLSRKEKQEEEQEPDTPLARLRADMSNVLETSVRAARQEADTAAYKLRVHATLLEDEEALDFLRSYEQFQEDPKLMLFEWSLNIDSSVAGLSRRAENLRGEVNEYIQATKDPAVLQWKVQYMNWSSEEAYRSNGEKNREKLQQVEREHRSAVALKEMMDIDDFGTLMSLRTKLDDVVSDYQSWKTRLEDESIRLSRRDDEDGMSEEAQELMSFLDC